MNRSLWRYQWLFAALLALLSSRNAFALPFGVSTTWIGGRTNATGCNEATQCHGFGAAGAGTAASNVKVSVNGAASVALTGTPTFTIPFGAAANTFAVTFHNSNGNVPTIPPAGGFLVFHNDGSSSDGNGLLGASTGSHTCNTAVTPYPISCPGDPLTNAGPSTANNNTEVTHDSPFVANASGDIAFSFTYIPPTLTCGPWPFRLWINAVNGDGANGKPDLATAFDFSITTSCPANSNPCHQTGCVSNTCNPNKTNGVACGVDSDSNACTDDTCSGGNCSVHSGVAGRACTDDSNVCTDDKCDATGACTHNANTASCSDGKACTSGDTCSGKSCGSGPVTCPDVCSDATHLQQVGSCSGSGACQYSTTITCPGACTGGACTTGCTSDANCTSGFYCNGAGACTARVPVGGTCASSDCKVAGCRECDTGAAACTDGICCATACAGGTNDCTACNLPGHLGTCFNVTNTTACGAVASCAGNVLHPHQQCTNGSCVDPTAVTCNGVCDAASASCGGCTSDSACLAGSYCDNTGTCVAQKAAGQTCNLAAGSDCKGANCRVCASGNCVDGYCCNTTCGNGKTDDCTACNIAGKLGTCSSLSLGANCNADSSQCTQNDACNASGTCMAGAAVVCPAPAACQGAGTCSAATGACTLPLLGSSTTCAAAACLGDGVSGIAESKCTGAAATCPAQAPFNCFPNQCVGSACRAACAVNGDCAPGAYCNGTTCAPKLAAGQACPLGGASCTSGFCTDGVCCDRACSGQCEACDVGGSAGTCSTVSGPPHGAHGACSNDGSGCGGSCDGTNALTCAFPASTTQCRAPSCDVATATATLSAGCNGAGACPPAQTSSCAPFLCGTTACKGDCTVDGDCQAAHFCAAGVCKPKFANGQVCSTVNQCASNLCVDGVCCDTSCTGQCQACDVIGRLGTCSSVPQGQPHGARIRCDGAGPCQAACDGSKPMGCAFPGATKLCSAPTCANGVQTGSGTCNGAGACGHPTTQECNPYACGITSCRSACAQASDCARGFDCIGSSCISFEASTAVGDASAVESGLLADAGPGIDASLPQVDAASARDAGDASVAMLDASASEGGTEGGAARDGGAVRDGAIAPDGAVESGADSPVDAQFEGSCGCTVPGGRETHGLSAFALSSLVGLVTLRRRKRHAKELPAF